MRARLRDLVQSAAEGARFDAQLGSCVGAAILERARCLTSSYRRGSATKSARRTPSTPSRYQHWTQVPLRGARLGVSRIVSTGPWRHDPGAGIWHSKRSRARWDTRVEKLSSAAGIRSCSRAARVYYRSESERGLQTGSIAMFLGTRESQREPEEERQWDLLSEFCAESPSEAVAARENAASARP